MRILFITPWYPTASQPVAGIFVQRDAQLVTRRHDVEVLHLVDPSLLGPEDDTIDADAPVRVHRVPMSRRSPLSPALVWNRIRTAINGADIVHTHAFQALLPFAGRRVGRPWVHSEHWSGVANPASFNLQGRMLFRATSRLLRRPDVVTAVSSFLLDRVRDHRSGTTMIVPSVVAESDITPVTHAPGSLRLVTVANLVEGKDPMLAVDTVDLLRRRGIDVSLRWAGDGPLRTALESRVADDPAVIFLGALDRSGVSDELARAEIFFLPTRGETLCLSALEAISHGRPVVMGAHGGQRDYVTGENGILVSERSPQAYADAILKVSESFDRFDPQHVADTIQGRFTPQAVLEGYESAYAAAFDASAKGSPR